MKNKRKTKIIATLGPASDNVKTILDMIKAGVDIFRLNFSHGDYKQHDLYLSSIRKAEKSSNKKIKVLVDLEGNKIRLTKDVKGDIVIKKGQKIVILKGKPKQKSNLCINLNHNINFKDVKKGSKVFIDDAKIELEVTKTGSDFIECKVMFGEKIGDKKGVHFPDLDIRFDKLSKNDEKGVLWSIKNSIDYIAQSFVQDENDIIRIKDIINKKGHKKIKIIAKIENKTPFKNLKKIFNVSDGVMIARGDLGVSMTLAKVPLIQKKIAKLGNIYKKSTIVATQLLDSMVERDIPTRAEASDISNAIFDGNEMLLLSNETTIGKHPVKVIEELVKIIIETEKAIESGEF